MEIQRMTKETLQQRLHDPDMVIIDLRHNRKDAKKIAGALLEDSDKVKEWAANYRKDLTLVLYCS